MLEPSKAAVLRWKASANTVFNPDEHVTGNCVVMKKPSFKKTAACQLVHTTLEAVSPLALIEVLLALPFLFFNNTVDGQVYIYDLATKQRIVQPVAQLPVDTSHPCSKPHQQHQQWGINSSSRSVSGSTNICGVNVLEYNHAVPSVLAAAAGDHIKVEPRHLFLLLAGSS